MLDQHRLLAVLAGCGGAVLLAACALPGAAHAADPSPCGHPVDKGYPTGWVQYCALAGDHDAWVPVYATPSQGSDRIGEDIIGWVTQRGSDTWFWCQRPGGSAWNEGLISDYWAKTFTDIEATAPYRATRRQGWVPETFFVNETGADGVGPDSDLVFCDGAEPPPSRFPPEMPFPPLEPAPLNGSPPSTNARLTARFAEGGRRKTVPFGGDTAIGIRLTTPEGVPIASAGVELLTRELRSGTRLALRRQLQTDAAGRASVRLGRGPSRQVRFEYRVRAGDRRPVATVTARIEVRAPITLRLAPRVVRGGGSIHMRGRLPAPPPRSHGKLVALQAHERGRWRLFKLARATRRGRYHARWHVPTGARGSYLIRAVAVADASYPYAAGRSRPVRVHIR